MNLSKNKKKITVENVPQFNLIFYLVYKVGYRLDRHIFQKKNKKE